MKFERFEFVRLLLSENLGDNVEALASKWRGFLSSDSVSEAVRSSSGIISVKSEGSLIEVGVRSEISTNLL